MYFRNPDYGEEARTHLRKLSENSEIHLHILDMSKPRDVTKFVKKFKDENMKLDVLINNAGCMLNKRSVKKLKMYPSLNLSGN